MIKKFKEFKESQISHTPEKLSKLVSSFRGPQWMSDENEESEEFEDQFLRLKEVFNCEIFMNRYNKNYGINYEFPINPKTKQPLREIIAISIYPHKNVTGYKVKDFFTHGVYLKKVYKELKNIESRIKSIYSPTLIFINKEYSSAVRGGFYFTMDISTF